MKFQTTIALDKHLKEAGRDYLARVILLVSPFEADRKRIVQKICSYLPFTLEKLDAGLHSVEEVLERLNTQNLFGSPTLLFFDGIDKLKKPALEKLARYCCSPSPFAYLLMGASSAKQMPELYDMGKKEMLVLDLCEEKPWDRVKRLQRELQERAQVDGYVLPQETVLYLTESVGPDREALEQELEKLICYCGEKKMLGLEEARASVLVQSEVTGWQLSEGIAFRGERLHPSQLRDPSFLISLIGQVRYQLHLGAQIASGENLESLRPQVVQKWAPLCKEKGLTYFQRRLVALFELDLASKSSATPPAYLWERFLELA